MLKRILCCVLAIIMIMSVISLTACNNTSNETEAPTEDPMEAPTEEPTEAPTEEPTEAPTEEPTEAPTEEPTEAPTEEPTEAPTEEPTEAPTEELTEAPTEEPTEAPTEEPTEAPTEEPTEAPTEKPTEAPTEEPTEEPSENPDELKVPEYKDAGISGKIKVANIFTLVGLNDGLSYVLADKIQYKLRAPVTFTDSVVYMDAKGVAAIFGLTYSETDTTATITTKDVKLNFTVGNSTASVNGSEIAFPKVIKENGTIMISVDFVARWLGCTVKTESDKVYIASSEKNMTSTTIKAMDELYDKYKNIIYNYDDIAIDQTGVGIYEKTPYEDRVVGIAYSTWHVSNETLWGSTDPYKGTWDTPLYGEYYSDNVDVIYQHGIMLRDAGVDFVFVDWTNNTSYNSQTMWTTSPDFAIIEDATDLLFEVWSTIEGAPKICIFAGPGHVNTTDKRQAVTTAQAVVRHQDKVDQIYENYVEKYPDLYYCHEGKPLLMCYGATPHEYGVEELLWEGDDRFTVRWVTGYVGEQNGTNGMPNLYDATTRETYGFWSWEERGLQTFTVSNNMVECVTVSAATRMQITPYIAAVGREDGMTLKKQFQRANDLGAGMVLVVSWNEWRRGEQPSVEVSKDIEPSKYYGTYYYDLLCEQIKKYKGLVD